MLNRLPAAKEDLLPGMLQWPDNQDPGAWYYLAVQEATNSHTWKEKGEISEQWTELTEAPDWSRYETFERLVEETIFEDIGTLHDRYQEFGIYPLLTLLASFA